MRPPLIKPQSLSSGDSIGIIAPASPISRELLQQGCLAIEHLGFKPVFYDSIFSEEVYFAGSHELRMRELHTMFSDPQIRGIFCARGGYGTNYLLPRIDMEIIRKNPKVFLGYSDVTALLTHFYDSAGLVTFHGPMVTKDFAQPDGVDIHSLRSVLGGEPCNFDTRGVEVLSEGEAEGVLYGGCLSMLAASLGTPYEVRPAGTLLFIEDIAAKPYQVDRMLTQLKYAGKLNDVRGIVFGEMVNCIQSPDQSYTLQEVVLMTLKELNIPMIFGLRSGHVSRSNITLPLGIRAKLRAQRSSATLETLEPATRAH